MVLTGLYTLAACIVLLWAASYSSPAASSPLAGVLANPLGALAVFAPFVLGLVVQLIGRRFWAWPYVYMVVFCQTLPGVEMDFADQVYGYITALVWILTVFVAESVGLAAGRFIHRYVGIAFFLVAGSWLLFTGLGYSQDSQVDRWHAWLLFFAGVMFYVHTGFQFTKLLAGQVLGTEAGEEIINDDTRPPLPPAATGEQPDE